MSEDTQQSELKTRIHNHIQQIYPGLDIEQYCNKLLSEMGLENCDITPQQHINHWDQSDIAVISYGDTFRTESEKPLETLHDFLKSYLKDTFSIVHILPFFPFSSDDGFAVIEYSNVNDAYGEWRNIENIATDFKLMADLVINHCSGRSQWFEQFKLNKEPGKNYFYCCDPEIDLSDVVRPRTSPLLRHVPTPDGDKYVWCTFSHDQPDLNFENPDVLLEFVKIIYLYLEKGIKYFRLDAVAFLWKEPGTNCINLPQTHEIIRLLRTLIEHHTPDAILITETNIPNRENLAYFGNSNEAHIIYNFSLPPLLLHTLLTGNCHYMKNWLMSMPPAMMGTTYLNFIASHDGIGLRPIEGLLEDEQVEDLIMTMESFGGYVSWRALEDENKPYEINITLYDALKGTIEDGPDEWQHQRFICAHVVMLGLEGIPAFYIHSLLATENDQEKFKNTNNNRAINRHNWDLERLNRLLSDKTTHHKKILDELLELITIRRKQPAFHPNATQFTLHFSDQIVAFWRQSIDRKQSIFCISNISKHPQEILLSEVNLIETDTWTDLISKTEIFEGQTAIHLEPYQSLWLSNTGY